MKRLQTLALEQKEDARHGDATFPIQKYITSLKPDYPVITTLRTVSVTLCLF